MNLRILSFSMALALAAIPSLQAQAPAPRTKEAAIRELLDVTGAGKLGLQVVTQMVGSLKTTAPDLPEAFWSRFMAKVNVDEMVEMVVPIYAKHLTLEEVEDVVAFYKTPSGRKVIATMPVIMGECITVGQAWGMKIGQQAAEELKAERAKTKL
jgi:hypothetical protein